MQHTIEYTCTPHLTTALETNFNLKIFLFIIVNKNYIITKIWTILNKDLDQRWATSGPRKYRIRMVAPKGLPKNKKQRCLYYSFLKIKSFLKASCKSNDKQTYIMPKTYIMPHVTKCLIHAHL